MKSYILLVTMIMIAASATASETVWVSRSNLGRHTWPLLSCGIVGQLAQGDQVIILEKHAGWARITIPCPASCRNGVNLLVQRGNTQCSKSNGVEKGYIAEWVEVKFLSSKPVSKIVK